MADDDGVWRSIGGRRVFIKSGQSLNEAMRECGKFPNGNSNKDISAFGTAYLEYSGKPDEAIEHLLKEQNGYVPAAIHKDGIGDIDFVWGKGGKEGFGFAHIIEERTKQGIDGVALIRKIPDVIKRGEILPDNPPDRKYIIDAYNRRAVIRLDWDGKKKTWLVSIHNLTSKK